MLLTEELTLLALDSESGRLRSRDDALDRGLAAALLLDLAQAGHIRIDDEAGVVLASTSPRFPVLGVGLSRLSGQMPLPVRDAIAELAPGLGVTVLEQLVEAGMVTREVHRTVVLKVIARWHPTASAAPDAVRDELTTLLTTTPDRPLTYREASLATVLGGARLLDLVQAGPSPVSDAAAYRWCDSVAAAVAPLADADEDAALVLAAVHDALASSGGAGLTPASAQSST